MGISDSCRYATTYHVKFLDTSTLSYFEGFLIKNYCSFAVNSEANSRRIALVESCFGTSGQPLAVPGRVLVGEGVLNKMCRKKSKPRQIFLFNDILVYGNIVIAKKKVNISLVDPIFELYSNFGSLKSY